MANTPDLLHVPHAGDTVHDGEEDDRRYDHLNCFNKYVPERPHLLADLQVEVTKYNTYRNRTQDLNVEVGVPFDSLMTRLGDCRWHCLRPTNVRQL